MAITIFVPGFKTNKSDERHGDGMVIHSDTGYTLVIDGFDGGAPTTSLLSYLKEHRYKDLHLLLSHPHYDHYKGLRTIMSDSYFNVKTFYCYDPESIKHGIGSSANGRAVKDDYNNLNACISQTKGKGAKIEYLAKGRTVILGDIEILEDVLDCRTQIVHGIGVVSSLPHAVVEHKGGDACIQQRLDQGECLHHGAAAAVAAAGADDHKALGTGNGHCHEGSFALQIGALVNIVIEIIFDGIFGEDLHTFQHGGVIPVGIDVCDLFDGQTIHGFFAHESMVADALFLQTEVLPVQTCHRVEKLGFAGEADSFEQFIASGIFCYDHCFFSFLYSASPCLPSSVTGLSQRREIKCHRHKRDFGISSLR